MSVTINITHDYATPTERIPHPVAATVTDRMSWLEIDKVTIFGTVDELRDLLDRAHAALNAADIDAQAGAK
jgi:hypothetical protein